MFTTVKSGNPNPTIVSLFNLMRFLRLLSIDVSEVLEESERCPFEETLQRYDYVTKCLRTEGIIK